MYEVFLQGNGTPAWTYSWWQSLVFSASQLENPAISDPAADADGDGWPNILEYALLGGYPLGSEETPTFRTDTSGDTLQLVFDRELAIADTTLMAEASDSPAGPWEEVARSVNGRSFVVQSGGYRIIEDDDKGHIAISDRFSLDDPASPRRFFRLRALITDSSR